MKIVLLCLCAASLLAAAVLHPLDGQWFGSIDTDRGTMQIGLELHDSGGKLTGAVKTPHGDWPVTSVSDDKGAFTVVFNNGDGSGKMEGRVEEKKFTGKWDNSPYATGTFELTKR